MFATFAEAVMGMIVLDREHRIVWFNEGYRRFIALGPFADSGVIGRRIEEVVPNSLMAIVELRHRGAIARGDPLDDRRIGVPCDRRRVGGRQPIQAGSSLHALMITYGSAVPPDAVTDVLHALRSPAWGPARPVSRGRSSSAVY